MTTAADSDPDYGPRGYLPERAAHRARKIILRERMGLGWPLAAVVAAVVLAVAGGAFLVTRTGPPGAPFAPLVELGAVDTGAAVTVTTAGREILVVRTATRVQAFVDPGQSVAYCGESGLLEAPDGSVWDLGGRLLGGPGRSLAALPTQVHAGVIYADAGAARAAAAAPDSGVSPRCTVP